MRNKLASQQHSNRNPPRNFEENLVTSDIESEQFVCGKVMKRPPVTAINDMENTDTTNQIISDRNDISYVSRRDMHLKKYVVQKESRSHTLPHLKQKSGTTVSQTNPEMILSRGTTQGSSQIPEFKIRKQSLGMRRQQSMNKKA